MKDTTLVNAAKRGKGTDYFAELTRPLEKLDKEAKRLRLEKIRVVQASNPEAVHPVPSAAIATVYQNESDS